MGVLCAALDHRAPPWRPAGSYVQLCALYPGHHQKSDPTGFGRRPPAKLGVRPEASGSTPVTRGSHGHIVAGGSSTSCLLDIRRRDKLVLTVEVGREKSQSPSFRRPISGQFHFPDLSGLWRPPRAYRRLAVQVVPPRFMGQGMLPPRLCTLRHHGN